MIAVASLSKEHHTYGYPGVSAVTSQTGISAIIQHQENFHKLQCQVNNCSMTIMQQKLKQPVTETVLLSLPEEYTCHWYRIAILKQFMY